MALQPRRPRPRPNSDGVVSPTWFGAFRLIVATVLAVLLLILFTVLLVGNYDLGTPERALILNFMLASCAACLAAIVTGEVFANILFPGRPELLLPKIVIQAGGGFAMFVIVFFGARYAVPSLDPERYRITSEIARAFADQGTARKAYQFFEPFDLPPWVARVNSVAGQGDAARLAVLNDWFNEDVSGERARAAHSHMTNFLVVLIQWSAAATSGMIVPGLICRHAFSATDHFVQFMGPYMQQYARDTGSHADVERAIEVRDCACWTSLVAERSLNHPSMRNAQKPAHCAKYPNE
jgi:hypothetical protein